MLTIAAAAARLAATSSLDDVERLLAPLGFSPPALPLDDDARTRLGVPHPLGPARVMAGPGALRALLVELPPGLAPRAAFATLAARLHTRTPHVLWLLAAVERDGPRLGVACFTPGRRAPRVVTLAADRRRIVQSDAETLRALTAARTTDGRDGHDTLTHARWTDLLGREALTRRFYRALESTVARLARQAHGPGTDEERTEVALLAASRLLFLAFLEGKGWLDGDPAFLARRYDDCIASGGHAHRRLLEPLLFGTLNTPARRRAAAARAFGRVPFLNGGLFARTPLERRLRALRFDDASLGALLGDLLGGYRFTAHEESDTLAEVAVDPEMLGRAFESLMASRARRETGAFYTPQPLVARVTDCALAEALHDRELPAELVTRALEGDAEVARSRTFRARLGGLTVLDPACGSGAFLVHALERLAALDRLGGDARPIATLRRERLTRSIFGVDCSPTAVWLCELRLWLSVVVECDEDDPLQVPPLPNLDRNVRVGDALAGGTFDTATPFRLAGGAAAARLRERYARATGARKATLARALDREERRRALGRTEALLAAAVAERREALLALRARDLFGERPRPTGADRVRLLELRERVAGLRRERRRIADGGALPFRFAVHFPEAARDGGFRVIVGNPPWVRLHRIPPASRERLRRDFIAYRHAAWEAGAERAHASRGFASQVDLAALFTERSLDLLRPGGTLALLLPSKLWRTLAGGGVRRVLAERALLRAVEDWSESPAVFDAAVYPSLLVATRRGAPDEDARADAPVRLALQRAASTLAWCAPAAHVPLDATAGSPWLVVPAEVRAGFERLRRAGVPLADSPVGRPQLGVKSGCNEAFVVAVEGAVRDVAHVVAPDGRRGCVEAALLRPLVAGHALAPWHADGSRAHLLWTHGADLEPLERLPPHAVRWLAPWRRRLERRTDARGRRCWWSLFRVEAADASGPRVVWGDVGRAPRAAVLPAGDPSVPLNSCYVLRCVALDDAHALAALLNGPLAAAWLAALAEPARGGYHRYLGWTMGLLPLPHDWPRARAILAPVGARASEGTPPAPGELLDAALRAYRVSATAVAPLLAWFPLSAA